MIYPSDLPHFAAAGDLLTVQSLLRAYPNNPYRNDALIAAARKCHLAVVHTILGDDYTPDDFSRNEAIASAASFEIAACIQASPRFVLKSR